MRLSAPAVLALSVACASEPPPVDPGETLGLGGAAGSGSSWWSEQVGEGRCANLVPQDGWSAGLDPDLLDAGDPYADIDAGLTQVVDALAGEQAFDAVPADLWIDGAVISNVGSSADAELWFADGLTVIPTVDLTSGVAGARPGDRVRFHVNAVKKDYGTDKIAGIDSFEILERDQPIQVVGTVMACGSSAAAIAGRRRHADLAGGQLGAHGGGRHVESPPLELDPQFNRGLGRRPADSRFLRARSDRRSAAASAVTCGAAPRPAAGTARTFPGGAVALGSRGCTAC